MRTCGLCGYIGVRVSVNEQGDPRCVNGPDVGCGGIPPLELDAPPDAPPPDAAPAATEKRPDLDDDTFEAYMRWLEERTRPPGATS